MTNFKKFAPVVALAFALSPFAAGAVTTQNTAHKAGYLSGSAISQFAENSKGRPGENQAAANSRGRATDHYAANSKGRAGDHYAVNSKGRPAEFTPASNETAANSKGRPAEFAEVADNSQSNPPGSAPTTPETPMG